MKTIILACIVLSLSPVAANAQYYPRYAYSYPGRGYYAAGGYHERYLPTYRGGYSMPRTGYSYRGYAAPRYHYDFSWGGGNRAYLGGRGGGWGGEW